MHLRCLANGDSVCRPRICKVLHADTLRGLIEYAAAFFLLGGSLKDAVNVCIRNMSDWQLAVALARVVEGGDDGPVLGDILNNTVIPLAFKNGNRYLASWAFWLLHRRDLAVRILVVRPTPNVSPSIAHYAIRHPCRTWRLLSMRR